MQKAIFLSLGFVLLLFTSNGQEIDHQRLNAYLDTLETHNKFMGSVAILQNGKVDYAKAIGYKDVSTKDESNVNSKYRIGSISKTFTAVLTFMAVEEKKIKLSQKIHKFFPSIKNAKKISVLNLLNHRSGIKNFTSDPSYTSWLTESKSEDQLVQIITDLGSEFKPGTEARYSNSNYVLLTYILERIYNISYEKLLDQKIVQPLGLKNTYFGHNLSIEKDECFSYTYTSEWTKQSETHSSIPLGAGAIISTPSDLVMFIKALFEKKLITEISLNLMKTMEDDYGLGIFEYSYNGKTGYGHSGGIDGFSSMLGYFPEEKMAYAFTSNGSNYNTSNISSTLMKAAFGQDFDIPSFKTYKVSSEEMKKYLGKYTSPKVPMDITISQNGNVLSAQGSGQPAFHLEAYEKDVFIFDPAGVKIRFNPSENTLTLIQGGFETVFTKEE